MGFSVGSGGWHSMGLPELLGGSVITYHHLRAISGAYKWVICTVRIGQ